MRILFDNGTPRGVASVLVGHYQQKLDWPENRDRRPRQGSLEDHQGKASGDCWAVNAATPGSFTEVEIPLD